MRASDSRAGSPERQAAQTVRAARVLGAALYGVGAAAVAILTLGDGLTLAAARETAPLAFLIGAAIGAAANPRWPTLAEAIVLGLVAAAIGFVFFCAVYIFAEALIAAALTGAQPGAAVAGAVERLMAAAVGAVGRLAACFIAANLALWLIGAAARGLRRRRDARASESAGPGSGAGAESGAS